MKRKLVILIVLSQILLLCACQMNELNNTKAPSKLTVSDVKQLIGVTYSDIEKIYGSPKKCTYYINSNDLYSINNKHVSLRNFNYHSIIKAYYDINSDDSYIILWYKNNKVVESYFYENDVIDSDYFNISNNNIDIQISYNKSSSKLNSDSNKIIYKNYIGTNIKDFYNKYDLIFPQITVNLLDKNNTLYFYNIKNTNINNISDDYLFVTCDNDIIIDINIIKQSSVCESIIEYVKQNSSQS